MPDPFTVVAGVSAVASLFGGKSASSAQRKGGIEAQKAAYANAEDMLSLAVGNAGLISSVARENAAALVRVGEANAQAVERATIWNLALLEQEGVESLRRFEREVTYVAGQTRAMSGSSGFQVNTGTPELWKVSQIEEGIRQREYMRDRFTLTAIAEAAMGQDRAGLIRLESRENAAMMIRNADLQTETMLAEMDFRATSMRRDGDLARLTGAANSKAQMWSTIGDLGRIGMGYFG